MTQINYKYDDLKMNDTVKTELNDYIDKSKRMNLDFLTRFDNGIVHNDIQSSYYIQLDFKDEALTERQLQSLTLLSKRAKRKKTKMTKAHDCNILSTRIYINDGCNRGIFTFIVYWSSYFWGVIQSSSCYGTLLSWFSKRYKVLVYTVSIEYKVDRIESFIIVNICIY